MSAVQHVVLLGLMGSGKTSIGRRVAKRLGRPLLDGDEALQHRTGGRTAADVTNAEGTDALHALEIEVALELLTSPEPAVIGPAASVVESAAVRAALADHVVVWLRATAEHHAGKAAEKAHRPLPADVDLVDHFREQLAVRGPLLLTVADLVVDVGDGDKDRHAETIADFAAEAYRSR